MTGSRLSPGVGLRLAASRARGIQTPSASRFPLSIHASGRYLIDANDDPFLLVGESCWLMLHRRTSSEIDSYIADRTARGFNAAMLILMCDSGAIGGGYVGDNNANGDAAFSGTPLIPANIVPAYWAHVDAMIHKFEDAGMVCMLAAAYANSTWWADLTSTTVAQNWGQWVGARYNINDFPNIIWIGGGDQRAQSYSIADALEYGIYQGGGTHLHTYHNDRFHNAFESRTEYAAHATWLNLNAVYCDDGSTNGTPYTIPEQFASERAAYTAPVFLIEDWYADEHSMTDTAVIVEKWQAYLNGACGANTGSLLSWTQGTGYAGDWSSDASIGAALAGSYMASVAWTTLVPKQDTSLVSSSLGSQGPNRICPALLDGGAMGIVLVPTATSPTVVMSNFTPSSVRARWMDIKTGSFTAVSGSPFANTGSQSMTHPGNNSMGTSAWVLVLDAAP
jgi:hypothetical protein